MGSKLGLYDGTSDAGHCFVLALSDGRGSPSWSEPRFRLRFLSSVYLHLQFVRRYLEITDVNGNHLTADAAALVVGGAFLGGARVNGWSREGGVSLNGKSNCRSIQMA